MAKTGKNKKDNKTSKIADRSQALEQHQSVIRFLNQELVLTLKEIFPSDATEFWLLDLMLKSKGPVPASEVAKFTHLTEGAVSQAVPRLNEYLDIFSKRCEVLETKKIAIQVPRKKPGGASFGYYLAFFDKKKEAYLSATEAKGLYISPFQHVRKHDRSKIEEFKERLEAEALEHIKEKLHGRGLGDYRSLELEIGFTEDDSHEEKELYSSPETHNRVWKEFDHDELENPQGIYILSSEVGDGKTTFLRKLQLTMIEKTDLIPIFLEASEFEALKFKKRNPNSFLKSLSDLLDEGNNYHEFLISHQDDIVFLIDGLDQIEGIGTEYRNLVDKLQTVVSNKVILTSRPFAVIDQERVSKIKFLRLKPFAEKEAQAYFGEKYEHAKELCSTCPEMIHIPMLAYMVRHLIEEGEDGNVKNRTNLYKNCIDSIIEEYRHENLRISREKKAKIRKAYGEISFKAIANNIPYLQKIPLSFVMACKNTAIDIDDLFKHGLAYLIVNRSQGTNESIYFGHQSFQEYLAAEHIKDNNCMIEQVLKEKWNPKWKEVIKFLAGILGEDFIKKIYSPGCKDNCIHSRLFLAAECCRGVPKLYNIEKDLFEALEILVSDLTFQWDVLRAISDLNLYEGTELLLKYSLRRAIDNRTGFASKYEQFNDSFLTEHQDYLSLETLCLKGKKFSNRHIILIVRLLKKQKGRIYNDILNVLESTSLPLTNNQISELINYECLTDATDFFNFSALWLVAPYHISQSHISQIATFIEQDDTEVRFRAINLLDRLLSRPPHESIYEKISSEHVKILINCVVNPTWNSYKIFSILGHLSGRGILSSQNIHSIIDALMFLSNTSSIHSAMENFSSDLNSEHIQKLENMLDNDEAHIKVVAINAMICIATKLPKKTHKVVLSYLHSKGFDFRYPALLIAQKAPGMLSAEHINAIIKLLQSTKQGLPVIALEILNSLADKLNTKQIDLILEVLISNKLFLDCVISEKSNGDNKVLSSCIPLPAKVDKVIVDRLIALLKCNDNVTKKTALVFLWKTAHSLMEKHVNEVALLLLLKSTTADIISLALQVLQKYQHLSSIHIDVIIGVLCNPDEASKKAALMCLKNLKKKLSVKHAIKLIKLLEKNAASTQKGILKVLMTIPEKIPSNEIEKVIDCSNHFNDDQELSCYKNRPENICEYLSGIPSVSFGPVSSSQVHKNIGFFENSNWFAQFHANNFIRHMKGQLTGEHLQYIINISIEKSEDIFVDWNLPLESLPPDYILQCLDLFEVVPYSDKFQSCICKILLKVVEEIRPMHTLKIAPLLNSESFYVASDAHVLLKRIYESGRLPE